MTTINKQWRLKARPVGEPSRDTWDYTETELPTITDGQLLIKIEYISIDPAMRGWLNDAKSYIEPVSPIFLFIFSHSKTFASISIRYQ